MLRLSIFLSISPFPYSPSSWVEWYVTKYERYLNLIVLFFIIIYVSIFPRPEWRMWEIGKNKYCISFSKMARYSYPLRGFNSDVSISLMWVSFPQAVRDILCPYLHYSLTDKKSSFVELRVLGNAGAVWWALCWVHI